MAALLALTLLSMQPAWADQGLEKQVKFDYLEKVLTLRHFYSGEHLKFHSDGTLQGNARFDSWTVDGQIEVEDVHLRGALLIIEARRIHRIFDAQGKPLDQLTALKNQPGKQQKDLEKVLQHLKVEIQIELPSQNPDERDVSAAIHAVFLTGSESMTSCPLTGRRISLSGRASREPRPRRRRDLCISASRFAAAFQRRMSPTLPTRNTRKKRERRNTREPSFSPLSSIPLETRQNCRSRDL
jgi:hypothetical protein